MIAERTELTNFLRVGAAVLALGAGVLQDNSVRSGEVCFKVSFSKEDGGFTHRVSCFRPGFVPKKFDCDTTLDKVADCRPIRIIRTK